MKIRCPGGKLAGQTLKVLENEIRFAENGLAEAAHLTDAEVQRLVRFGFEVIHEPVKPARGRKPAQAESEEPAPPVAEPAPETPQP